MTGKFYVILVAAIIALLLKNQGDILLICAFMLALFYLLYRNKTNTSLLIVTLLTFALFYFHPLHYKNPVNLENVSSVSGKITSIPKYDGNKISFDMKNKWNTNVHVNYYAKSEEELIKLRNLRYGMHCQLLGGYEQPSLATNFYAFNYQTYLASREIYYLFKPTTISLRDCQTARTPYSVLQTYRQEGMNYIVEHFPKESSGIIVALIFGDRSEMELELLRSYQSLGIIHLLAVSGLHVGLVITFTYYCLIRFFCTKERAIELLLFLLPVYATIAGAAPSVLRATLMAMLVLLMVRFRIQIHPLDGISIVCLFLLFLNPLYLLHLGFQLSFFVSFALIISAKTILQRYQSWQTQMLAVTVVAQVISFPVLIYHFYEVSILSIPINLIYIPFITFFALPFAFISTFFYFFLPPIGYILLYVYNFVMLWAHHGIDLLNDLPNTKLTFGKPPLYLLLLYFFAIGCSFIVWEKSSSLKPLLKSSCFFLLIVILHWNLPFLTAKGEITMLDVGQGESILIELPYRRAVYLIDTGGVVDFRETHEWSRRKRTFDVGNDVLLPFLKAKGIRSIDKLILTHGHFDHIGGAEALIGEIKVKQILYGIGPIESIYEKELLDKFSVAKTSIQFVKKGDYWKKGNNEFYILSPAGGEQTLNNRSIVIYALINGVRWLFTGDLEEEGEKQLLKNYPNLAVDILKVAHHGSKTSTSELSLDLMEPSHALIPVGRNNRYGHPHDDVLRRLKERNIIIYRTDEHGAIRYQFKKNQAGKFETKLLQQ